LAIASDTEELAGAVSGAGSFSLSTENEPLLVIAPDTLRVANSVSGASAATISAALGHLSPASARAYVHLNTEPVREAIEKALGLDSS
jgi:hypothetical protein